MLALADRGRKKVLRLLAWQYTPTKKKEYPAAFERAFDCTRDCKREDGSWDTALRRARGCTRHDLPPVRWDVDMRALYSRPAQRHYLYFGRLPVRPQYRDLDPKIIGVSCSEDEPLESPFEGCPGGPPRSPFADSVVSYARTRTKDGGRVPNRFLDAPETPWQVWEAVHYFEGEQDSWHRYREQVDADRWRQGPGKPRSKG